MPRTSLRAVTNRRQRGITLIEMSVVVVIIMIMATLIQPNYTHLKEGLNQRAFTANLRSEVLKGRSMAIQDGKTVTLGYDGGSSNVTLSEPSVDSTDSSQAATAVNTLKDQPTEVVHQIAIPSGVTLANFRVGSADIGAGDFKLRFYPDGRCDGGGIELQIGKATQSLKIDVKGYPTYLTGALPDSTNEVWAAGTYEQRNPTN